MVSEKKLCLYPIATSLKVLKVIGGFPLTITESGIISSKLQLLKLGFYLILVIFTANIFTLVALTLPDPNPVIYMEIFKSVGFSNMDFVVGSTMLAPNIIACFVCYFALNHEYQRLEEACEEMEATNRKHLGKVVYNGKGRIN